MDHDQEQNPLYPFHSQGNNSSTGNGNNNNNNNSSHTGIHSHSSSHAGSLTYHHTQSHQQQELQQHGLLSSMQPQHQAFVTQHTSQHGGNSDYHGYHGDLQKAMPHQMDIYQSPPQSQNQQLINPLLNRHLNSPSQFQTPHHQQQQNHPYQEQHHHSQHPYQQPSPYNYQQQHQQHQQHPKTYPDQHSNPATPSSTTGSASTISSATTPTIPYHGGDYPYFEGASALSQVQRNGSPAASFHVPGNPAVPTSASSQIASPSSAHHLGAGLSLAMPAWTTTTASPNEQDIQPRQHQNQAIQSADGPHPPSHVHSQPARDLVRSPSYYQSPHPQPHIYSPQGPDQHHDQPQPQPQPQPQQHHQIWAGNVSSSESFLEQPDRQQKQARPFGNTDNAGHSVHESSYAVSSAYMGGHDVAGTDRVRVQSNRNHPLAREYMDYSNNYNSRGGQGSSMAAQHPGLHLDGLPLMPPSHLMHSDPQGQSFSSMSLLSGPGSKAISASLDSVPIGLGPPTIMAHPEYGTVASYMPAPTTVMNNKPRGSTSRQRPMSMQSQPTVPKLRERTNSATSSTSITSSGILSSLSTALGAASLSFPNSPTSINAAQSTCSNIATTVISMDAAAAGSAENSTPSDTATTVKPRPGGHPRKTIAARVFECSFPGCNKAYTQLHNLKSHERTGHTPVQKPKPFLCIISGCTKAFSQRKSLALHIRASHKEFKFKPFKCLQPGCQKAYTQLHNLRTHEKTVHMLDLSRKRIRIPTLHSEGSSQNTTMPKTGGSSNSNGRDQQLHQQQQLQKIQLHGNNTREQPHQKQQDRQFSSNVEPKYEYVGELADYSTEAMDGEDDVEEEGGDDAAGEDAGEDAENEYYVDE